MADPLATTPSEILAVAERLDVIADEDFTRPGSSYYLALREGADLLRFLASSFEHDPPANARKDAGDP